MIIVLAEGRTEYDFIKQLFLPYFARHEIQVKTTIVKTGRASYRGGVSKYKFIRDHLLDLINSKNLVTMMFDLLGFPSDIPGFSNNQSTSDPFSSIDLGLAYKVSGSVN